MNTTQALIIVFGMPGCDACKDYIPRLEREVKRWQDHQLPFIWHRQGATYTRKQIPIAVYDVTSNEPSLQQLCEQFGIENLPTTMLLTYNARPVKVEGAIDDKEIYAILESAALASR